MRMRLALATMFILATVLFGISASANHCDRGQHHCASGCCDD
jgi:hypothetical protein